DTLINTRYYINKYYEKEIDFSNNTNHYHYIYGDNGVVALHVATAATDSMYYIHTDHLGSYCAITNSAKMVRQRNWFDPWGNVTILSDGAKGKPPGHYSSPTFLTFSITNRGFTGHEHYLDFKIINMNGRLYDPVIGRFFSPDKYVANSSFTQDFNRYSYARNNPLMYVDPSGEFFWFFPTFSWSKEGGLSIGFTFGIGIPGIASFSANVGYNFKHNDFSASVGATAAFNTVYASYSTQSGFSVGWTAGMTSYAGFPISSNIATVGANYNLTNKTLGGNISAFQWQQDQGWSFNPSLSMAIAPEQFSNLIRGQGFRSNSEVYDRMMSGEALRRGNPFGCQDIINYFGFRGTYDPSKTGGDPGAINGGKIFYGDGAFSGNYDRFALIAYHELRHSQNVKTGKYKGIDLSDRSNSLILGREEWDAYSYNYRNQGLYLNSGENLVGRIQTEGMNAGIYEVGPAGYNTFTPAWWHFIYKIPRLW
ncbi:MAG: hypothetical protein FWH59_04415, partial [Lentimicrobiaceae bacterium]|nr:hypothetical protein [Lentimicrobiaceae bacterium]